MSREHDVTQADTAETADLVEFGAEAADDDLERELAAHAPRQRVNRITFVLAGLLLVIGGFIAGSLVQKGIGGTGNSGATTASNGRSGNFGGGGFGAGSGPRGGTGQASGTGAPSGAGTTGTVKLVDGTTIYLTTAAGEVVTVKTTGTTKVSTTQAGSLKNLKAGATVTVQGQTGADGTVTATTVTAQK
jgi:hypothetical protein